MIIKHIKVFSFLTLLCLSTQVQAAGFYLQEQSVSGQGNAFAGAAANPNDASTIFFNPAGLTSLDTAQMTAGVSLISPRSNFTDNGSTAGLTAGAQAAFTGTGAGSDPFSPEAVPNFYAAMPLGGKKKYWLGLGLSAPFGLANEYDASWFGRYDSTKSDLKTLDIAPVFAARIAHSFSIGGGPNIQHAKAILETALPCPNAGFGCGAAFNPASDGLSRLEGDSWDVGYNIGAMWDVTDKTKIGAHYRSAITNDVPGVVTISGLAGGLAAFNGSSNAKAKLKLPDIFSLGLSHQATDTLKILASYNRFGWNNFDAIPVVFDSGAPSNIVQQNYKNSYSVALGAEWEQSDTMTWRFGTQFDQTPTTDADRSTRTPDGNRFWLSLGGSYKISEYFSIDAAATHIMMDDGDITLSKRIYAGTAADSTVNINGTAENKLDILSVQAVWKF